MNVKLNYRSLLGILLLLPITLWAQERSKTVNNSWTGVDILKVSHRYGTLDVIPSNENEVRLEAIIVVKANDPDDAQVVVDHFIIDKRKFGSELELETKFNSKSWVTSGNSTTIKFDDGDKAKGVRDINISYKLYVPKLQEMKLSNKYNDIIIHGDITTSLFIKQYDGKFEASNINGPVDIELKYSKGEFGNCGDGKIELYDSKLKLIQTANVLVNSKYSEFNFEKCKSIEVFSHDDEARIGTIAGKLKLNSKYSEFSIGDADETELLVYDSDAAINSSGKLSGKSKYSEISRKKVQQIDLESSYDDSYEIGDLRSLKCRDSKYSEFDIEAISESIEIESYDDLISATEVRPSFNLLDINCKYTTVRLPLDKLAGYELDANTKYGSLRYPDNATNVVHRESNESLSLKATIGTPGSDARIVIIAHDRSIRLN